MGCQIHDEDRSTPACCWNSSPRRTTFMTLCIFTFDFIATTINSEIRKRKGKWYKWKCITVQDGSWFFYHFRGWLRGKSWACVVCDEASWRQRWSYSEQPGLFVADDRKMKRRLLAAGWHRMVSSGHRVANPLNIPAQLWLHTGNWRFYILPFDFILSEEKLTCTQCTAQVRKWRWHSARHSAMTKIMTFQVGKWHRINIFHRIWRVYE